MHHKVLAKFQKDFDDASSLMRNAWTVPKERIVASLKTFKESVDEVIKLFEEEKQ